MSMDNEIVDDILVPEQCMVIYMPDGKVHQILITEICQ